MWTVLTFFFFRPDLVDFRKVQVNSPRQNLEQAFSIAEREFGVTRLLDPEGIVISQLAFKVFTVFKKKWFF